MKAAVSPARATAALDDAPIAHAALDFDWCFVYVNKTAERLAGRSRAELIGLSLWEVFPDRDAGFKEACRCAATERRTIEFEQYWEPSNAWYWVTAVPTDAGISLWGWDITAHHEASARLESSERRKAAIIDVAHEAVVSSDVDGRILEFNAAAERLFGYTRDEARGWRIADLLIPPERREGHLERMRWFRTAQPEELARPFESEFVRKDGTRLPAELALTRYEVEDGVVLTAVVHDLSSERAHRELVEDIQAIVWEFDVVAGRLTFINQRVQELLGYDVQCWLDDPAFWYGVVHPDDRERLLAAWSDPSRIEGSTVELEFRMLAADGSTVVLRDHARITRDAAGAALRMRGVAVDVTEQRSAETRLRAQENRFRTLVEQLPLAVYRESIEDGFATTYVSPQVAQIFGYGPDRWTDDPYFYDSLIHSDDRERVLAALERTREHGDPFHEEFRVRAADGSTVWVEDHAVIVEDENGPALQGYVLDVTARKAAEALHAESDLRYRLLVEQLPLSVYMNGMGADRTPVYISPQIEGMLGYSIEDWHSDPDLFDKLLHPDDREHVAAESIVLRDTGTFHDEYRLFGRDGRTVWIEHAAVRIDREGEEPVVQGYLLDISERKRAEVQRQEVEMRYRSLVEHLPLVTYTNAVQGAVESLYMSPQVADILGYPAADWVGRPGFFEAILHPDDRDAVMADVIRAHETGERYQGEYRLIARDGRIVWVHDESAPVLGLDGEPIFIQGYFIDITERKELEQQLVQAQKMEAVGRLAGGIAHDFNNLLTAIGGYAEFLLGGLDAGDPLREDAVEIARAADRAAGLTRQLLAFSRRQVLQPRTFDLNEVVTDMKGMLKRLLGEDMQLELDLGDAVGPVRADPNQIEQVIMNLAVNARDAMPGGGRVTIRTYESALGHEPGAQLQLAAGSYSVMEVVDTGSGIDPDVLTQLFDPFFTTKEKGKGTGLGLATVYGIVKQSGGDVAVTSVLGQGSSFRVYLPHAGQDDDERALVVPAPAGGGVERVLLVEDEEAVRALVSETLRRYGYEVIDAADAQQALRSVEELAPDILVTDIVMPGTGGHELAARVREHHPTAAVLYMSGYTDDAIVRDTLAEPGAVFLQKPFGAETLARKVREALDARDAA